MNLSTFIPAISALATLCLSAAAQSVFSPVQDNTLYEDSSGLLSNGSGEYLFSGQTAQGDTRRAVLAFDLSAIAPGTQVASAELQLSLDREPPGDDATPVSAHTLLGSWGEAGSDAGDPGGLGAAAQVGDATWIHSSFNSTTWGTPGGDFTAAPSATTSVDNPGTYSWSGAGVTADVQGWVDNPSSNNGYILIGDEAEDRNARRYGSREGTAAPRLLVTFAAVPEPSTLVLLGAGLLVVLGARRRAKNSAE